MPIICCNNTFCEKYDEYELGGIFNKILNKIFNKLKWDERFSCGEWYHTAQVGGRMIGRVHDRDSRWRSPGQKRFSATDFAFSLGTISEEFDDLSEAKKWVEDFWRNQNEV